MISESKEKEKEIHGEDEVQEPPKPKEIKPYVPPVPFPQRLKQQQYNKEFGKFFDMLKKLLEAAVQNQGASIQNLEVQVGQLANMISRRNQGALPNNTEINPNEQVNAITLRSEKQIQREQDMISESKEKEKEIHGEDEVQEPSKPKEIKPYMPPVPFPQRLKQQ
ncbi:hypothetical protein SLEP1_g2414 [Rubroshorea leprosula]|uniref:Uncharacterized protein n=1 Tax=Rubroshorea leprosula TaxID=152421 RepID=A0AAV5HHJ4_9ROSI|nr:hypothetical protein SLEP1_g2414 [Rubroshorea leprosula]